MRRGYALPLVLGLLLLLSTALTTALLGVRGSQLVGESSKHRRQALHNAEGVGIAAVELVSEFLRGQPMEPPLARSDPGYVAALQALLEQQKDDANELLDVKKPLFTTSGYNVKQVEIDALQPARMQLLGAGAYEGMQAQVQAFVTKVGVVRVHDRSPAVQAITAQVERATMSMFQFYVFADGYLDLDPGGLVETRGRIHANGDFCVAGEPKIGSVTSAGRILVSNNPNAHGLCRRVATETRGAAGIQVVINDSFDTRELPTNFDHTSSDWASRALSDYNGHLRDKAHGVVPLRMPVTGAPIVQAGANVLAMEKADSGSGAELVPHASAKEDNTKSLRFLVDPLLRSEPADIQRQKFAFKADIRIIDGIWYLRDVADPASPGTPIWSDHPGSGAIRYDDSVYDFIVAPDASARLGQEDLRSARGWSTTPQKFSYYGFTKGGSTYDWARPSPTPRAVISYGLLRRDAAGATQWSPGHYTAVPVAGSPAMTTPTTVKHMLEATRFGIKNGWLEVRSEELNSEAEDSNGNTNTETKRSRLLPINVDVAALVGALQDCTNGELGSYFPGTCGAGGRKFNGVVYVTSTWPRQMDGMGSTTATSTFATLAPFNDGDPNGNQRHPMPLCSPQAGPVNDAAGEPLLPCNGTNRSNGAFPNVVRVFNARHVNPESTTSYAGVSIKHGTLENGLTIATNLPIIAQGDVNVDTTPLDHPALITPGDYFVPVLLAGDRFYRYSNAWRDEFANWQQKMTVHRANRIGTRTTQYIEILAGWNPTPAKPGLSLHDHSSDGFEDFPRYNECWTAPDRDDAMAVYRGSIVVAFASVFERAGANNADGHGIGGDYLSCFPPRNEGYDFHLEDPRNQPPGAPLIVAQSISSWRSQ